MRRTHSLGMGLAALGLFACSQTPTGFVNGDAEASMSTDATQMMSESSVDAGRCPSGVDTDVDGADDDVECARGTNPMDSDSDDDGLRDGQELNYPRTCVAQDRARQRRPTVFCNDDRPCMTGERCVGLDPLRKDTDEDGIEDDEEERFFDGTINQAMGETDPRLWDTNGDGISDAMSGIAACRADGLGMVTITPIPPGTTQLGFDPVFGSARRVTEGTGALLLEDRAANVAAATFFSTSASTDVRSAHNRIETLITGVFGMDITPVLVGRSFTTHERFPALTSTYRVMRANSSASALRDLIVDPIAGTAAPATPTPIGMGSEFFLDVTTVRRVTASAAARLDIVVAIAPVAAVDDRTSNTAIRMNDLLNATGISEGGKTLGNTCQVFRTERTAMADFIWAVDTSGSMGDDQMRLANVATNFFTTLSAAGVDFRVGVFQAGSTPSGPNLASPGFSWINGSDPRGATRLCEEVTDPSTGTTRPACPASPGETLAPYRFSGGAEEPVAASVILHNVLSRESDPNRRLRPGALPVFFFVTDEPGSNDYNLYFSRNPDPMTGRAWGSPYNTMTLENITSYFRRNGLLTFGLLPVERDTDGTPRSCSVGNVADLHRCVVEGNNGAVIPIATATDAEILGAMTRIVEAAAGASSPYALTRSPITSSIRVRVRGMEVPRSRSNGYDYDAAARSILFYGPMYRPRMGDEVVVSYRVWEGSLG